MKKNALALAFVSFVAIALLLFSSFAMRPKPAAFEKFMIRQDSLMMNAYHNRDIIGYKKLVLEAESRFSELRQSERDRYIAYMANAYYNFACLYSLEKQNLDALNFLEMAIQYGYSDYSHLKVDTDLDNIRLEPRYEIITKKLRSIGDYLWILKQSAAYNNAETQAIPPFTYQASSDPNLTLLRTTYKLDSVAGTGTEVEKIINLMHWIHERIPHNGNKANPDERNALSLLRVCSAENRTLNCRGLATVLNEMYLSMGFASRLVTCLPKDSLKTDPDCHVINAVYSKTLGKWLWMDPTNDAYVMDEHNNLLSIQEVRSRLILDLPLKINETANWNHKEQTKVEDYLYNYMAKNLYKIECAIYSCYDYETSMRGKVTTYVQLVPMAYKENSIGLSTRKRHGKKVQEVWYTQHESKFWAAP